MVDRRSRVLPMYAVCYMLCYAVLVLVLVQSRGQKAMEKTSIREAKLCEPRVSDNDRIREFGQIDD